MPLARAALEALRHRARHRVDVSVPLASKTALKIALEEKPAEVPDIRSKKQIIKY